MQKSLSKKKVYDALWQEGYHAKVEREIREKEMRGGLQAQVAKTLAEQIRLKDEAEAVEKVRNLFSFEEILILQNFDFHVFYTLLQKFIHTLRKFIYLLSEDRPPQAITEEEKKEMHVVWANAEREAKELVERESAVARSERVKVNQFKEICEIENAKAEAQEKLMDKQFVRVFWILCFCYFFGGLGVGEEVFVFFHTRCIETEI